MTAVGDSIPPWTMAVVDPQRMKTMAAILRDPYQVHWDRVATTAMGLDGKVVNQGPLNLSYIANMLMAWQGEASIRRLTVSFGNPVLDGDHVTAHGTVTSITVVGAEQHASCAVWLERDGEQVVTGTAVVALSGPVG